MGFRSFFIGAILLTLGIFIGVHFFEGEVPREPEPEVDLSVEAVDTGPQHATIKDPDIIAEDIELVQGGEGRIDWRVKAKRAEYSESRNLVLVTRPQLSSFVGEDRQEVFVRSELGEVDQKADNLRLWDGVDGRYGLFALQADTFEYLGAMNKVYITGDVILHRPEIVITAPVVEVDVTNNMMQAVGGVEAEITPP